MTLLILLGAVFMAGLVLGAFTLLVLGMRTEDPFSIIDGKPQKPAGAAARRVVSVWFRRPGQIRSPSSDERR